MTDERAPTDGSVSPSEFMRRLRPELYSDSTNRARYELDRPTLEYHLQTLTARNQTHAFELFGRKLCSRTICPNLRPATGPEGGGDSKVDAETLPVADELATLLYVGDADAGRERWAFAFSAKERWADKSRADVAAAVGTGRQPPTPTDHRQLEAHSLIDVALWNQAKWRGVAFLGLSESGPPGMGLLFDNAGPARAIFNRLRGRLGPEDAKNELLVAIVQALPDAPAAHYRVLLTSNPESLAYESSQPGRLTAISARIHTMEPTTDENLQHFLRDHGRAGVYLIAPAVMHPSGVPHTFAELAILKRRLVVKSAVNIGPNDIEAIALPERAG